MFSEVVDSWLNFLQVKKGQYMMFNGRAQETNLELFMGVSFSFVIKTCELASKILVIENL